MLQQEADKTKNSPNLKRKEDYGYQRIQKMLVHFGVPPDGVLLLHSSFKSFARDGYVAKSVLQAFCDYMSAGTLLLPTMSWRFVKKEKPFFDVRETPSNTGILTELFRTLPGVIRSVHPTHSVAGKGKDAAKILATHQESATPCDHASPFGKMQGYNAHVIMLGVGMDCCTLVHHVEEYMAPELYVKPDVDEVVYECSDSKRHKFPIHLQRHMFLPRNYWQFQDILAYQNKLQISMLDNSPCLHYLAKDMVACVEQILQNNPAAIIAKPGERYRMM